MYVCMYVIPSSISKGHVYWPFDNLPFSDIKSGRVHPKLCWTKASRRQETSGDGINWYPVTNSLIPADSKGNKGPVRVNGGLCLLLPEKYLRLTLCQDLPPGYRPLTVQELPACLHSRGD